MITSCGVRERDRTIEMPTPPPAFRRLRVYSFDPYLTTQLESALFAEVALRVPWEKLGPGPIGEYVEVIDFDPASDCFYQPVALDEPHVLAQDGLPVSDGNPQFHQQMVYAVAMNTIKNFERALGRWAFWAPRKLNEAERSLEPKARYEKEYVQRLRIYPHALRQANAYYSPVKKALLFGYFPAAREAGGMVFTCLSHDVIAHETTHALLDGMHGRFLEPSHPDTRAFHEAFADLVALFQRFSIVEVVRHQIAKTRGDIGGVSNLLGALAQQVGQATGCYGSLRDAIGTRNPKTGAWEPQRPNPADYLTKTEEHARGAILVGAVFDAFLAIYRCRIADLQRIASNGTGVLPQGELHPDLVNRFAQEAAKTARQFCNMCIRALDYCPPVDITFGDYLRALITADRDVVPDDDLGYRVALIESFRRRGILPEDLRTISEESLLWDNGALILQKDQREASQLPLRESLRLITNFLKTHMGDLEDARTRKDHYIATQQLSAKLHDYLETEFDAINLHNFHKLTGLKVREDESSGTLKFQVHSLRPARRVGPDGDIRSQIVISLLQKRKLPLDPARPQSEDNEFALRGGCTLILDLDTMDLRYAVKKPIDDERRIERQRTYLLGRWGDLSERAVYFGSRLDAEDEPFALMHGALEAF